MSGKLKMTVPKKTDSEINRELQDQAIKISKEHIDKKPIKYLLKR